MHSHRCPLGPFPQKIREEGLAPLLMTDGFKHGYPNASALVFIS